MVGAKMEGDDHPPSESLIDLLTETFKEQAAKRGLRAAGICYDVLTVPPGEDQKRDAICCGLEHCTGEWVDVFLPYVKAEDGDIQYGKVFSAQRIAQFFGELPRC